MRPTSIRPLHVTAVAGLCLYLGLVGCGGKGNDAGGGSSPPALPELDLASRTSAGAIGTSVSDTPSLSADGRYVAFRSASVLVAADTNAVNDIYRRDRVTGTTTLVSVSTASTVADSDSSQPSISGDGRRIAFASTATTLIASDGNAFADAFVRDVDAGTTVRVAPTGVVPNGETDLARISRDGRYVVLETKATNFGAFDSNADYDIYRYDVATGSMILISAPAAATATANHGSVDPTISDDGNRIAFASPATDLVTGDTNGQQDIFVHTVSPGSTRRVDLGPLGVETNANSYSPRLSGNGRFVAFVSNATNLVAGDTNAVSDIFVADVDAGTVVRASVSSTGEQANGDCGYPAISADGRFVAFRSTATNLVANDTNALPDVFVRDLVAGTTVRVSVDSNGAQATRDLGYEIAISADGTTVGFTSASPLVVDDTNLALDVYVRRIAPTAGG